MSGSTYSGAGVDTSAAARETSALARVLARTASFREGTGESVLDHGYYASALRITDDLALAVCTDGVGSKLMVAERMDKLDTVGIDCIAMNVNDLVCVGAEPLALVDYVAVESLRPGLLEEIAKGLVEGARQARITIPGGETAQLPEMIRGSRPGHGVDLVGTAVGLVSMSRLNCGRDVEAGDVVLGLESSGLHSNGYTLARKALLETAGFDLDTHRPELGRTVGEEMLEPTRIYVREALDLFAEGIAVKALLHITGDGLLNLARTAAPVGWEIDRLPDPPAVFELIRDAGRVDSAEMFTVFNMGIGMCVVVREADVERTCKIVRRHGATPHVIGRAVAAPERTVRLPQHGLAGHGTRFAAP